MFARGFRSRSLAMACLFALAIGGLGAQDAAALRTGLRGTPAAARAALAKVTPGLAGELVADVAALLRSADATLRNEAAAWLGEQHDLADRILPLVAELRRDPDPDVSRAAGAVGAALRARRRPTPDDLRAWIADQNRIQAVCAHIAGNPDDGWAVLPELLAARPLSKFDWALQRLLAADRARFERAIARAIDAGGSLSDLVPYLGLAASDLGPYLARLDSHLLEDPTGARREPTIAAMTKAIAGGAAPTPNWLEILRRDDRAGDRHALLGELRQHAVAAALWPDLHELLAAAPTVPIADLILADGTCTAAHAEALRAALARRELDLRNELVDAIARLAPATRSCAPLLLPLLGHSFAPYVQNALLALGALGDASPAVLTAIDACRSNADPSVRELAAIAASELRQQVPDACAALSEAELIAALGAEQGMAALAAAAALRARGTPPAQWIQPVLARGGPHGEWLESALHQHLVATALYALESAGRLDARLVPVLAAPTSLGPQEDLRRNRLLAQSGPEGRAWLAERLVNHPWPLAVIDAFAAAGADAADCAEAVAPFVHHPDLGLREHAVACLAAIAGEAAVAAARAAADPWPRILAVRAGRTEACLATALDAGAPRWLRREALARIGNQPDVTAELLALLGDPDDAIALDVLQRLDREPGRLFVGNTNTPSPAVFAALAGGSRSVRAALLLTLRSRLQVPWPAAVARAIAETRSGPALPLRPGLLLLGMDRPHARACRELAAADTPPDTAWLLARLELDPAIAVCVLAARSEPPADALVPRLTALLSPIEVPPPELIDLLARSAPGQVALAAWLEASNEAVRREQLASAMLTTPLARYGWRSPDARDRVAAAMAHQWHPADVQQVLRQLPMLELLGRAADFATDDLVRLLRAADPASPGGELYAAALRAIGHDGPVAEWFARGGQPRLCSPQLLVVRDNAMVDRMLQLDDAEFALAWRAGRENLAPDAAHRDALATRLEHAIAKGAVPADTPALAFVFASRPAAALPAIARGAASLAEVLAQGEPPALPDRIAVATAELVELALGSGQQDTIVRTGRLLARVGRLDVAAILPHLDDANSRAAALQLLKAIGPAAADAAPAVAAIAAADAERTRFLGPHVLAHLGPTGVTRLVPLLVDHPEWISSLDLALPTGDEASLAAAANAYLALRLPPNAERARLLRAAVAAKPSPRTTSLLVLALLVTDPEATDADWLRVASLEPALVRRRALAGMGQRPLTPLQVAVAAELLDDPDQAVRNQALALLLADPARIAACRRALREFADDARTAAATAARVRAALE